MKRARVLLWVIGVLMCVISILLFTSPIDVFDRDDQPKTTKLSEALQSSPTKEAARLAPTEIAPQQPDQLDVLHLDSPAQNSPHAIAPDVEPPAAVASPATETKSSATADPIEAPSTAAPRDEFATITTTVTIRNGPSASADVIGRAHAGARARVASRDSGWSQIVDPASGNTGWVSPAFWCHRPLPRLSQPRNRRAKHLTRHWTRRWKIRVPKYPKRRIRQLSRGRPPKRNTIERTTIMVVGGSLSDFSLGASYANGLMSAYGTKQTCSMR